jgi:hypothetical protein
MNTTMNRIADAYSLMNLIMTFQGLAGTPFTSDPAGTLRVTTAPAPISASSPIVSPCSIVAPDPTNTLSPSVTLPDILAEGIIDEKLPIVTS